MRIPISMILLLVAVGCGGSSGPATGPPIPVADTIRTITGRVEYYTTGPMVTTRDGNGRLTPQTGFVQPTIPRRAPHFPVELLSPTGEVLAQGVTGATGEYSVSINFGNGVQATQVALRVYAQLNLPFGATVRVLPNPGATEPYMHESVLSGNPASEVMTVNLTIALDDNAGAY
ncbi:MAG: hypothetical protein ACYTF8_16685, partial [Planctomycetota bacterium]